MTVLVTAVFSTRQNLETGKEYLDHGRGKENQMGFKGFLKTALLAACCVMLFVSSAIAEEKTVITYWNGFTGADGEVMQRIIDTYNVTNTLNVEVQM